MSQVSKSSVSSCGGRRLPAVSAAALAMLAAFLLGCESKSMPIEPPPAPPTPEERFEKIVSALEDQLNDAAFGTAEFLRAWSAQPGFRLVK